MDASPSRHPTDQTLQSYGLGKLDDRSAKAINSHLEGCADCRQRVGEVSSDTFLGRLLIKPHNLMLTHDGKSRLIKVLDFGLAKATREEKVDAALTSAGQALGTPDYIAPEQILNATDVDIRADLYSLGGTLYYLLTGRPPFVANSLYDMYQAHVSRDADPLNLIRPEVPAELAALVSKMMAKDPGRRFQTPAEVAEALLPFFRKAAATHRSPIADVARPGPTPAARPDPAPASIPAPVATDTGRPGVRPEKPAVRPAAEARWEELLDLRDTDRSTVAVPVAGTGPPPNRKTRRMALGGSLFGLITLGVIILTIKHQGGEIKITAPDDKAFKVEKDGFVIENKPGLSRTDGSPGSPVTSR